MHARIIEGEARSLARQVERVFGHLDLAAIGVARNIRNLGPVELRASENPYACNAPAGSWLSAESITMSGSISGCHAVLAIVRMLPIRAE